MSIRQPGPWLFAAGLFGLGVTLAISGTFGAFLGLPQVPWAALVLGMGLAVGAAALTIPRARRFAAWALAAFWLVFFAGILAPRTVVHGFWSPATVSALQGLFFAVTALGLTGDGVRRRFAGRALLGIVVCYFGLVHISYPQAIGGMVPTWIPGQAVWPLVTGTVQLAGGLMILLGVRVALAAFTIGLMWLSWIPVVHAARVLAAPADGGEWVFMLTALALAGAAWTVGEQSSAPNPRPI